MEDKLAEFVIALDQDPSLQAQYQKDPKSTLSHFGVSDDDISMLLQGDIQQIKDRLEMSGLNAFVIIQHPR